MAGFLTPNPNFSWGGFAGNALSGLGAGLLSYGAGGQLRQQAPLIAIQGMQQAQQAQAEQAQRALQTQSLTQQLAMQQMQMQRAQQADQQAAQQKQAYLGLLGGQAVQGPTQSGAPLDIKSPVNPALANLSPAMQSMLPLMDPSQGMGLISQLSTRKPDTPNLQSWRQGNQEVSGYLDPSGQPHIIASGAAFAPQQPQQPTERERYAQLAGLKPGTPEYTNFMLTGGQQPDTFVDVPGPDGKPIGQRNLKTNQVVTYPQAPSKQPTNEQALSGGYADRMDNSEGIISKLENVASDPKQTFLSMLPGSNFLVSPERQQVEQAQRDFVNAQLRRESGAAISQSEFDSAKKQYFPQPGDSDTVISQKRKNRDIAITAMKRNAGPTYEAPKTQSNVAQPPTDQPDAQQAADGNWYVPDPNRPGKYLKVVQ